MGNERSILAGETQAGIRSGAFRCGLAGMDSTMFSGFDTYLRNAPRLFAWPLNTQNLKVSRRLVLKNNRFKNA
jgi:hypothetical protein